MVVFEAEKRFGTLQVNADGGRVNISITPKDGDGLVLAITRDEGARLLNDLSAMLGRFETAK